MNTKIKNLLEEGRLDGFFAYKTFNGFPLPFLFTRETVHELEPWRPTHARYPLLKLLLTQVRHNPENRYGILLRGCEERALHELYKWNQIQRDKIVVLGQACSEELARYCRCGMPFPQKNRLRVACRSF
jgi:formate dehydrogenase subunit beta